MGNRLLCLLLCLVLAPATAVAQAGALGVYADPSGSNCNVTDASAGLLVIYVVHVETSGASAAEFSAPVPSCMTATVWMADEAPPVSIGDSQSGIALAYGGCFAAPIRVLAINLFTQGLSAPCCRYPVREHPMLGLHTVDCSQNKIPVGAMGNLVNGNASCECDQLGGLSTWGKVKETYQTD